LGLTILQSTTSWRGVRKSIRGWHKEKLTWKNPITLKIGSRGINKSRKNIGHKIGQSELPSQISNLGLKIPNLVPGPEIVQKCRNSMNSELSRLLGSLGDLP
jgi:hypothetical protein